ncbi:universal stress protein [uncultured Ligilactobacillus sp.]|uniref:universal stress protein n=1 Tax=uncultured Ligilactobacillus sp. TaxID=2837633 RepID=UPI00272C0248|nr:universal stress protein [uncultured Ligilactobacillus sp.]
MDKEPIKNIKKILVGVDDSEDAQLAFRVAMRRALDLDATLCITSILESDEMNVFQALSADYIHGERKELEKHVERYRKIALQAGIKRVEVVIAEGDAGETIIKRVIPKVEPDLLIIGALSKKGVKKFFGSQAAYMAKHAPISVLVVR